MPKALFSQFNCLPPPSGWPFFLFPVTYLIGFHAMYSLTAVLVGYGVELGFRVAQRVRQTKRWVPLPWPPALLVGVPLFLPEVPLWAAGLMILIMYGGLYLLGGVPPPTPKVTERFAGPNPTIRAFLIREYTTHVPVPARRVVAYAMPVVAVYTVYTSLAVEVESIVEEMSPDGQVVRRTTTIRPGWISNTLRRR